MIKIGFLIYSLNRGGAERATVNLANYLSTHGWTVTVVTIRDDTTSAYSLLPDVKRLSLGLHADSNSVFTAINNNYKRISSIRNILKSEKLSMMVGMSSTANILITLACLGTQTLAIGSERSHPANKPISNSWFLLRKYGYRWLDLLVCLTDETNQWLRTHTNAAHIVTIPNGIDFPLIPNGPIIPVSSLIDDKSKNINANANVGKKYIISVGRLIPSKCVNDTIRAFSALANHKPDWELLILGDGPEKASLVALSRQLQLTDRVHFIGAVGNLHDWYTKSCIYVSTSLHEGFPNTLLEAMSYGLAVISYDCPTGPRDLIKHGINGQLVNPGDLNQLRRTLFDMVDDGKKRQILANNAKSCKNVFYMNAIGDRWMSELTTISGIG